MTAIFQSPKCVPFSINGTNLSILFHSLFSFYLPVMPFAAQNIHQRQLHTKHNTTLDIIGISKSSISYVRYKGIQRIGSRLEKFAIIAAVIQCTALHKLTHMCFSSQYMFN